MTFSFSSSFRLGPSRRTAGLIPAVILAAGCAAESDSSASLADLPVWTYDSTMVFPGDASLLRPEDGVVLADGRLIVGDQEHGLRLVEPDGSSRPFGNLGGAGYRHSPPAHGGGANGVFLEPGGSHVLVADVFGAAIYRVDVVSGETEKLYQHRYGINAAIRDSRGTIWFTQSARNTPEEGEAPLWEAVDIPRPEGAVYRIPMQGGRLAPEPELVLDSLVFPNGIALDEAGRHLFVSEMLAGRIMRYRVDPGTGALADRTVMVDSVVADNLELDGNGNLWAALPLTNEILVVSLASGARRSVFRSTNPEQERVAAEFIRRGAAGVTRLELFTPSVWAPLPGPITGIIVGREGPVYAATLGNALLRLPR